MPNTILSHNRKIIELNGTPVVIKKAKDGIHSLVTDLKSVFQELWLGHDYGNLEDTVKKVHDPDNETTIHDNFFNYTDGYSPMTQKDVNSVLSEFNTMLVKKFFLAPGEQPEECNLFALDGSGAPHVNDINIAKWFAKIDHFLKVCTKSSAIIQY